jgi:hypothetical protein
MHITFVSSAEINYTQAFSPKAPATAVATVIITLSTMLQILFDLALMKIKN